VEKKRLLLLTRPPPRFSTTCISLSVSLFLSLSLSLSLLNSLYIHYFTLFLYTNLMRKCTVETHTHMYVVTNRFFILQIVLLLIFLPISAEYIYNKKIIIIPLVSRDAYLSLPELACRSLCLCE